MGNYIEFAVAFCCLWTFVSGSQQHLVCKTVEDVFTEHVRSSSHMRGPQGPPGKIGPRGIRGIPGEPGVTGPPGAPAVVDYDRINQVIAEKVTSAVAEINSQIADLERNFTEFKELAQGKSATSSPLSCEEKGGFYNHQKCFTIPHVSSSSDMNYNEAVAECAKTGALLAEIHDRTQQQVLHDFAFSKMPSGQTYVYLWVGMEYQSSASTLLYRSGKEIGTSQFQWDQGFPQTISSHIYLILEVGNDSDSSVGLWNYAGTTSINGVVCETQA